MSDTLKFTRWASALHGLTGLAILALLALLVMQVILNPPGAATVGDYFAGRYAAPAIADWHVWLALGFGLLAFGAFVWTLTIVRRLLDNYRKGRVLTFDSAQLILQIGKGVALVAVLRIVGFAAQSVILSMAAPAGQRQLAIGLNSSDIGLLLAGGLFTVIGWAMRSAAQADTENKEFV